MKIISYGLPAEINCSPWECTRSNGVDMLLKEVNLTEDSHINFIGTYDLRFCCRQERIGIR